MHRLRNFQGLFLCTGHEAEHMTLNVYYQIQHHGEGFSRMAF